MSNIIKSLFFGHNLLLVQLYVYVFNALDYIGKFYENMYLDCENVMNRSFSQFALTKSTTPRNPNNISSISTKPLNFLKKMFWMETMSILIFGGMLSMFQRPTKSY